jgi:TetR/AcrR family fatty acid metabolism transcriptional regulator
MTGLTSRQEEIINAAIHIIAEHSAHDLSMRSVAELIGISEPALYRHFENKDDLLLKLTRYIAQDQAAIFQKAGDPDMPALRQLEDMLESVIKNYANNWSLTATLYATAMFYTNQELVDGLSSIIENSLTSIKRLVEKGRQDGSLHEKIKADQTALVIFGAMRLMTERWILSGRDFDLVSAWIIVWGELRRMLTVPA